MISHGQRRNDLQSRYAVVATRLVAIAEELNAMNSSDYEDSAIEDAGNAMLRSDSDSLFQELRQIEATLELLDSGDYGVCACCGDPISEDRLNTLPYTFFCRNCTL